MDLINKDPIIKFLTHTKHFIDSQACVKSLNLIYIVRHPENPEICPHYKSQSMIKFPLKS